eukprot:scaffold73099_cov56-Cyclotella_meneghiniana.AAC.1
MDQAITLYGQLTFVNNLMFGYPFSYLGRITHQAQLSGAQEVDQYLRYSDYAPATQTKLLHITSLVKATKSS